MIAAPNFPMRQAAALLALASLAAVAAQGPDAGAGDAGAADERSRLNEAAAARDRAGAAMLRGDAAAAAREADSCLSHLASLPPAQVSAVQALLGDCALEQGRALFQRGDPAGAAEAIARAEGQLGDLAAEGAKLRGESLLLSGRPAEAAAQLRLAVSLGGNGPVALEAAALLADALLDAGDARGAAEQASAAGLLAGQSAAVRGGLAWTRARALAQLATSRRDPREARDAAQAGREFWRDFPDHPAESEEPALEASLAAIAGGPLPEPSGRDRLVRAGHLLNAGQPARAGAEANAAHTLLSGDDRAEASLLWARALAADGRRGEAGPVLEEAQRSNQPRVAAAAMLLSSREHARRGESDAAVALLDRLAGRFPLSTEADEGALLAARLQLDGGKADDGRARLVRLSARRTPNGADARWALAWLAYQARRPSASEQFAACAALASDDESRARALYWQARASAQTAAAPLLRRALMLDPLGWYGLLARAALARSATAATRPAVPTAAAQEIGTALATSGPIPEPAGRLLRIGFANEAAAELDRAAQDAHGDLQRLLPILLGYQRAGRTDRSVPIAQSLLAARTAVVGAALAHGATLPDDPTLRALLEAAYPAAFPEAITASARRVGLDPDFIRAVARRESVFKPDARSAAGAVGLLQLLPVTARRAAAVLGRPAPSDRELMDPAVAVDLGAWYLAELLGRFRDPALAAAAYNAGPRAVAPWVAAARGEQLDRFVEEIPFKETRRYVKIVIGSFGVYRLLAGEAPPALAATVPEIGSGAAF